MFGKKIRVFYHGMPRQCNGCYQLGHMKWECTNDKLNWKAYVLQMRDSGKYEKHLFGSWLEERPQPPSEEPVKPKDLRDLLDLKSPTDVKKALASYLSKYPPKGSQTGTQRKRSRSRSPQKNADQRRQSPKRRSPSRQDRRQDNDRRRSPQKAPNKYKWTNPKYQGWQNKKRYNPRDRSADEKKDRR